MSSAVESVLGGGGGALSFGNAASHRKNRPGRRPSVLEVKSAGATCKLRMIDFAHVGRLLGKDGAPDASLRDDSYLRGLHTLRLALDELLAAVHLHGTELRRLLRETSASRLSTASVAQHSWEGEHADRTSSIPSNSSHSSYSRTPRTPRGEGAAAGGSDGSVSIGGGGGGGSGGGGGGGSGGGEGLSRTTEEIQEDTQAEEAAAEAAEEEAQIAEQLAIKARLLPRVARRVPPASHLPLRAARCRQRPSPGPLRPPLLFSLSALPTLPSADPLQARELVTAGLTGDEV